MLFLLTAALLQPATPAQPASSRMTDCRPKLILTSGGRETVAERRDSGPRRSKPCMTLASARRV